MTQNTENDSVTALRSQRIPSNTENYYSVKRSELPLSCPMPQMELWNSHPRIYLPIEEASKAKCPYCGAVYELVDDATPTRND